MDAKCPSWPNTTYNIKTGLCSITVYWLVEYYRKLFGIETLVHSFIYLQLLFPGQVQSGTLSATKLSESQGPIHTHSRTHLHPGVGGAGGQLGIPNPPTALFLEGGKKLEIPDEAHTHGGEHEKLHTDCELRSGLKWSTYL